MYVHLGLLGPQNRECGGQLGGWRPRSGCHTGLHEPMMVPWRDTINTRGQVVFLGGVLLLEDVECGA